MFGGFETQTRWTIRLLWVLIAVNAIAVFSGVAEYRLIVDLMGGGVDYDADAAADSNDLRKAIVTGIQITLWLVAAVMVLRWIRQANLNARALGARDMRFTPNWAIGWYFIPVMNLSKPYQAMTEIWRASGDPGDDETDVPPGTVTFWWIVWLATLGLNRVSSSMTAGAMDLEGFRIATLAAIAADAAGIVLCFAFMDIVKEIARRQSVRAEVTRSPALRVTWRPFTRH